jgi:protein gp37
MSMGDVFEGRADQEAARERLWGLIESTPWLDWLLLTKRTNQILRLVPPAWRTAFPGNVWVGTTAENQEEANRRIPELLKVPAIVRFMSAEPLLGPLDLSPWLSGSDRIDWIITGGESGSKARPSELGWFRSIRDQAVGAGVPHFLKQYGAFSPAGVVRLRKKFEGRELDGREWNEVPDLWNANAPREKPKEPEKPMDAPIDIEEVRSVCRALEAAEAEVTRLKAKLAELCRKRSGPVKTTAPAPAATGDIAQRAERLMGAIQKEPGKSLAYYAAATGIPHGLLDAPRDLLLTQGRISAAGTGKAYKLYLKEAS